MKKCQIINSKFSWILKVDDEEIAFQGSRNADYFKKHYESLGYKVEIISQF
jgi:uncharacterized protein YmfQ (DUF2313 family)